MNGGISITGVGVTIFQLLAAKSAIGLEAKGLKHSRGSVRKTYALQFGMSPRAKHADVQARIQQEIDKINAENPDNGIHSY